MKQRFDYLADRRKTESIKWNAYEADVLPMWVADMDFLSPAPVIDALLERVKHGIFGYAGQPSNLKDLIVSRMQEKYQWDVTPEEIILMPGVVTGFNLVTQAVVAPHEEVIFQTPVYPPFFDAPKHASRGYHSIPLGRDADGSYFIDFERFEQSITEQTRLFILCNPHNPVGRVFNREELNRLAEICLKYEISICSDEIHCDLVYSESQHIPIASINAEIAKNTITLMAPSKTFNIAGLDCSFAIIQDENLREKINSSRKGLVGGVNVLGLTAAESAYRYGEAWLQDLLSYLQENRDYLFDRITNDFPEIQMIKPEGTYLAWLDCSRLEIEESPYQFFLDKARVALNDGLGFGTEGDRFVRLNFGCPRSMLEETLDRMRGALDQIG